MIVPGTVMPDYYCTCFALYAQLEIHIYFGSRFVPYYSFNSSHAVLFVCFLFVCFLRFVLSLRDGGRNQSIYLNATTLLFVIPINGRVMGGVAEGRWLPMAAMILSRTVHRRASYRWCLLYARCCVIFVFAHVVPRAVIVVTRGAGPPVVLSLAALSVSVRRCVIVVVVLPCCYAYLMHSMVLIVILFVVVLFHEGGDEINVFLAWLLLRIRTPSLSSLLRSFLFLWRRRTNEIERYVTTGLQRRRFGFWVSCLVRYVFSLLCSKGTCTTVLWYYL